MKNHNNIVTVTTSEIFIKYQSHTMETNNAKILNIIKGWRTSEVVNFLETNEHKEYTGFVQTKNINGFAFLTLSEGIVALWKPRLNSKILMNLIESLKQNPQNYYNITTGEIINFKKSNCQNVSIEETRKVDEYVVVKREKPKVPVRVDSLKKEIDFNILDKFSVSTTTPFSKSNDDHGKRENEKINKADNNLINLENIVAPKSFLYSNKLIQAVSKLYPYLPMKISQDDVIIRKKTPFRLDEKFTESDSFQDAGYYEMTTRKSLNYGRRHSDSSVRVDGNTYEELLFKNKVGNRALEKKRLGILKRVLRKPTFRWDKSNAEEETQKSKKLSTSEASSNSKLQKFNTMVVKKFSSKIGTNYKMKNVSKTNDTQNENSVKTVRFKQFLENNDNNSDKNTEINIPHGNYIKPTSNGNIDVFDNTHYESPNNIDGDNEDLASNENFYEEADPIGKTFHEEEDIIDVRDSDSGCRVPIEVEDYLEPIKFYHRQDSQERVMDNLADEIFKIFDANLVGTDTFKGSHSDEGQSKEQSNISENQFQTKQQIINNNNENFKQIPVPMARLPRPKAPTRSLNKSNNLGSEKLNEIKENIEEEKCDKLNDVSTSSDRPFDTLHKWNESLRSNVKKQKDTVRRRSMIDRPLPVPVENEFYYMEVGRKEAELLLEGHADGTFILRPSSQSNHIYTVTLIFQGKVYNIGCRRRQDGRLALGFSKPGEQSFLTIDQLIQHYYTERLLLIQDGVKVGRVNLRKLNES